MVGAQATLAYDHPIAYPDPRINSYHILTYLFRFTNQNYLEDIGHPRWRSGSWFCSFQDRHLNYCHHI
jgi:hypothetical protein